MTNNEIMKSFLEKEVVSQLSEIGFTGKYPHFQRKKENCIELISFQTNKWTGSFTVEVSAVFPNGKNKNCTEWDSLSEEQRNVWYTNERYRLKGMYDGWFYYRDLYVKRTIVFGKVYLDVSEKQAADFMVPRGYKCVQKFNADTAKKICDEVNRQLVTAFKWLARFEKDKTYPSNLRSNTYA